MAQPEFQLVRTNFRSMIVVLRCDTPIKQAISASSNRIINPASSRRQSYALKIKSFLEKQDLFEDEHLSINKREWSHPGT